MHLQPWSQKSSARDVVQVAINTTITDVSEFLDHIVASTNMRCATPRSALEGECGFLAANLYAKSVFGEDALVNVSVEKQPDGKLAGYIRIRCVARFIIACSIQLVLYCLADSVLHRCRMC